MSQGANYELRHEVAWDNARRFGAAVAQTIIDAHQGRDTYYNVNFPYCLPAEVTGVRAVPLQRFSRSPFRYYPSQNAGKFYVAIPVSNGLADYDEYYEIDQPTFERYRANLDSAKEFVERCRARQEDSRLILKPGSRRGTPV